MASLLDMILGKSTSPDPLDQYLQGVGVSPTRPTQAPAPVMAAPVAAPPMQDPQTPPPAVGQPAPPPEQDLGTVSADPWKPHKAGILGTIADTLLGTHLNRAAKRQNMEEAFQGFTNDPLRTIKRVAKFNPEAAWTMYNVYHDNKIQDDAAKMKEDDNTWDTGMGLAAAANKDNWATIKPKIEQYWQTKGYDPGMSLPDEWSPEVLQGLRESHMQAKDQLNYEMMNGYRKDRLKDFHDNVMSEIESRKANASVAERRLAQQGSYEQQRLALQGRGASESERHNRALEGGTKGQMQPVKTKYGVGMFDPKKNTMSVVINGKEHRYAKVKEEGNAIQWQLLPEVDDTEDDN